MESPLSGSAIVGAVHVRTVLPALVVARSVAGAFGGVLLSLTVVAVEASPSRPPADVVSTAAAKYCSVPLPRGGGLLSRHVVSGVRAQTLTSDPEAALR